MKEQEFKVGDRVCLKKNIVVGNIYGGAHIYNFMIDNFKKHCTKRIRIVNEENNIYIIGKYIYTAEMLELANTDKVIFNGDKTTLISNGKEYTAICKQGDTFDKATGVMLAELHKFGVTYSEIERLVKESATVPKFKNETAYWNWFKGHGIDVSKASIERFLKDSETKQVYKFKKGDIVKVVDNGKSYSTYSDFFREVGLNIEKFNYQYGKAPDINQLLKVIAFGKHRYSSNKLYVLEDYGTNKKHYIMGEDGLELCCETKDNAVREVHRVAKVGEYIKLISNTGYCFDSIGDILKVDSVSGSSIYVLGKNHLRQTGNDSELWTYCPNEYVVLENYKPTKITLTAEEIKTLKELKRQGYKFIARDKEFFKNQLLWAFTEKPFKINICWHANFITISKDLKDNLFSFIKWSDSEPTSIEELLKMSK